MPRRKKKRFSRLIVALALIIALALFLFRERALDFAEYELWFDSLPASFDGYRIAHISDWHGNGESKRNAELYAQLYAREVDIIVVTGDLIDHESQIPGALEFMERLTMIAPVYYVTGNHEWAATNARELMRQLEDVGVIVVNNTYKMLEVNSVSIALVGVGDPNGPYDQKTPRELFEQLYAGEGECFALTLYHRNNRLEELADCGADLILSGHAHGGIIRLPFTDGLIDSDFNLLPGRTSGVYEAGGAVMVVSRGLSDPITVPRIMNPPHVPIITLRAGQSG